MPAMETMFLSIFRPPESRDNTSYTHPIQRRQQCYRFHPRRATSRHRTRPAGVTLRPEAGHNILCLRENCHAVSITHLSPTFFPQGYPQPQACNQHQTAITCTSRQPQTQYIGFRPPGATHKNVSARPGQPRQTSTAGRPQPGMRRQTHDTIYCVEQPPDTPPLFPCRRTDVPSGGGRGPRPPVLRRDDPACIASR